MFTTSRRPTTLSVLLTVLALTATIGLGTRLAGAEQPPTAAPALTLPTAAEALAVVTGGDGVLRFEVAEDVTRFVFADAPLHEDGMPARGNAFVTQGYIYPAGTLNGSNGSLPDGSPEFPEKVLGEWTCKGWFVGDGAHTTSGPMVHTTQAYNFGGEPGAALLISEGYELADAKVPIGRAITGGTGAFVAAEGEATQTMLGFTEEMAVNLGFEIPVAEQGEGAAEPSAAAPVHFRDARRPVD